MAKPSSLSPALQEVTRFVIEQGDHVYYNMKDTPMMKIKGGRKKVVFPYPEMAQKTFQKNGYTHFYFKNHSEELYNIFLALAFMYSK